MQQQLAGLLRLQSDRAWLLCWRKGQAWLAFHGELLVGYFEEFLFRFCPI